MSKSLSRKQLNQLKKLHRDLYNNFTYITDEKKRGVLDLWEQVPADYKATGGLIGDCEEFARYMCVKLRELGHKARLIYCLTERGEGHLVCEDENYLSGNRYSEVRSVRTSRSKGYDLIAISGYEPGEDWHVIGDKQ